LGDRVLNDETSRTKKKESERDGERRDEANASEVTRSEPVAAILTSRHACLMFFTFVLCVVC
jgi:hypothetical protein